MVSGEECEVATGGPTVGRVKFTVVMQSGWWPRTASPLRTGSPDGTVTQIASLPKTD